MIINNTMEHPTTYIYKKMLFTFLIIFSIGIVASTVIRDTGQSVFTSNIDLGNGNLTANEVNASKINNVLYVEAGNGSDIQAKIDEADVGTLIILPSGNYSITDTILLNKQDLSFSCVTSSSFRKSPIQTGTFIFAGDG